VLSLFSSSVLSSSWLKTHVLQDDRVLRAQNLAGLDIWNHCLNIAQIEPLSRGPKQHIYEWNMDLDWLPMAEFQSNHQGNRVAAEERVTLKEKELPPSASGYGPQPDLIYGTGLCLETAVIRNIAAVVGKSDAGGGIRPIPESHRHLTDGSSRELYETEQWTYNSPNPPLYRCSTCNKQVKSKSELKYVAQLRSNLGC
jgi:hypothetical protein